jgi:hypothetical protein
VVAGPKAKSVNRAWTIITIDPLTGKKVAADQPSAIRVWAYRDRPVYTFADDKQPGDVNADSWGEFTGQRNGFKVFILRDDFFPNAS